MNRHTSISSNEAADRLAIRELVESHRRIDAATPGPASLFRNHTSPQWS